MKSKIQKMAIKLLLNQQVILVKLHLNNNILKFLNNHFRLILKINNQCLPLEAIHSQEDIHSSQEDIHSSQEDISLILINSLFKVISKYLNHLLLTQCRIIINNHINNSLKECINLFKSIISLIHLNNMEMDHKLLFRFSKCHHQIIIEKQKNGEKKIE